MFIVEIKMESQHVDWTLNEIQKRLMGPSRGERACFRGSEYILFKILD